MLRAPWHNQFSRYAVSCDMRGSLRTAGIYAITDREPASMPEVALESPLGQFLLAA